MKRVYWLSVSIGVALAAAGCGVAIPPTPAGVPVATITPRVVTEAVRFDTDDPAIWIDRDDVTNSLVLGTDKETDGALYAFDLKGKIIPEKTVRGLARPNNVDIGYGLKLGGKAVDIAVVTEREKRRLRVFAVPSMESLDEGDLAIFPDDATRAPMGVALYTRPRDGAIFAIVGGKSGPAQGYLGQYRMEDDGAGKVKMTLVRQFGGYSGQKEIESIAVDNELGHVYYSDEGVGVRKYAADPDADDADRELARFATSGFAVDHEGISIYKTGPRTGYVLVSDQGANRFWIYRREGAPGNPHEHAPVKILQAATRESDGSEVTAAALPGFPRGLFVAMSTDKTFHYYAWEDIAGAELK